MVLTFAADTREEMEQQLRDYLGDSKPAEKKAATKTPRSRKKKEETIEEEAPAEESNTVSMKDIRELMARVPARARASVTKYMEDNYGVSEAQDIPDDQLQDFYDFLDRNLNKKK